jgi:two-component system, NtrC family, response regulator AtoC
LFLDEMGEMPLALQAKLLRVLQEGTIRPVGATSEKQVDVRIICATNRDLSAEVEKQRFRQDLYYRLMVFPIKLPPLRERRSDLIPIAKNLLHRVAADLGRPVPKLTADAEQRLLASPWRGNVRELANALERAAILADGSIIDAPHIWLDEPTAAPRSQGQAGIRPLAELEHDAIVAALEHVGGNRRKAAELLGIGERTLYDKLKKYGVDGDGLH